MRHYLLAFVIMITNSLCAQFGLRIGYGNGKYEQFQNEVVKNQTNKSLPFLKHQTSVGLDYWFRLQKRRIEFMPQISYTNISSSNANIVTSKGNTIDFYFNTNVYVFNLEEDCDCPTFSKDGSTIKKGFFLSVAPMTKRYDYTMTFNNEELKSRGIAFGLKLGGGIDIGINDFLTITPSLNYEASTMKKWEDFTVINSASKEAINSNYSKLFGEIRLGTRFDGNTKGRKRRR